MEKLSKQGKLLIIGIAVVIVVAAIVAGTMSQGQKAGTSSSTGTSAQTGSTGTAGMNGSAAPLAAPATPATPVISFVTPVSGDQWKIGQSNPIIWSAEAKVTGEIDLLDARTKSVVGVILSESGVHQTSYSWDTRQVFLSRYSPLKKDLAAGTYLIRMKFDGNNLKNITAGPVTIQ